MNSCNSLIFPIHLGQVAGSQIFLATLGFIATGVGIPLLGIIAIGFSRSNGLFDLVAHTSKRFATFFTCLLYLTIGPFFVIPRSASISYNVGMSTIIGDLFNQKVAYLIFSVLFFVIVAIFSFKPSGITTWIGKIINPLFLFFFFILIIVALFNPMGNAADIKPAQDFEEHPFFNGFLEGYGTMDVIAGIAFGIIIVNDY